MASYWEHVLDRRISRRRVIAASGSLAMGAAFLAGLAIGFWHDEQGVDFLCKEASRFEPSRRANLTQMEYDDWNLAIKTVLARQGGTTKFEA